MTTQPARYPFRGICLLALACCVLLPACSAPPGLPLRVGVNPWVGYDPLVLARESKMLDANEVRVVELESSGESARQLRNGLLEAAGLTLVEAVELAAAGVDLKVISLLSLSKGADAVVVRSGLAAPAALRGMRIGMENSALADIMLQHLLEAGGLSRDDVEVVTLSVVEHESALRRGQVDAVVTFEPVVSRLEAAGYEVMLDTSHLPGEVVDVLVIRSDALAAHPQQARALLEAFEQGRVAMLARPQESARMLAAGTDLNTQEYLLALGRLHLFSLQESATMLHQVPDAPALALQRLADDLRASRRVPSRPDWSLLFDAGVAGGIVAAGQSR
jgi:NitT/TauT family transport system substrate-binding protein